MPQELGMSDSGSTSAGAAAYDGYYDYGPQTILERPLGLVGFMGSAVAAIGHAMACKLGLPLLQVDRHVEHQAGMGLAALQLRSGEPARRRLEYEALARAARERPAGVVVLGDGALLSPQSQTLAAEQLQLVYVRRPLHVLHAAVVKELSNAPERYPEFALSGPPERSDSLRSLLDVRAQGYRLAEHVFDADRLHPQRVCDALIAELRLLA